MSLSHLYASHDLAGDINDSITLGDFNCSPSDNNNRSRLLDEYLSTYSYSSIDLLHFNNFEYSHKSGRLIDRIFATQNSNSTVVNNVIIQKEHMSSDHFPVVASVNLRLFKRDLPEPCRDRAINWKRASDKALAAYSQLSGKLCDSSHSK